MKVVLNSYKQRQKATYDKLCELVRSIDLNMLEYVELSETEWDLLDLMIEIKPISMNDTEYHNVIAVAVTEDIRTYIRVALNKEAT